jgi:hypothetical protein
MTVSHSEKIKLRSAQNKHRTGMEADNASQGCRMVYLQTKKPNLGKFWMALYWKMLIYYIAIWNILQEFVIFYDHLVHFVFICYIFSVFGIMYQEKSGNPDASSFFLLPNGRLNSTFPRSR